MPPTVGVVGAGPVGCLAALELAQRGFHVHVYERQSRDAYLASLTSPYSPNEMVTRRGLQALRAASRPGPTSVTASLASSIQALCIPVDTRETHYATSSSRQRLGPHGEAVYSLRHGALLRVLYDAMQSHHAIDMHMGCHVDAMDVLSDAVYIHTSSGPSLPPLSTRCDWVVGCDGWHSIVRQHMVRVADVHTATETLEGAWVTFVLPPVPSLSTVTFAMDPGSVHVWTHDTLCVTACPNRDASFTATLYAPATLLSEARKSATSMQQLVQTHAPHLLPYLPTDTFTHLTTTTPTPLGRASCEPMHAGASLLLLGDAAHTLTPFNAQGLNGGWDDVRIFMDELDAALEHTPLAALHMHSVFARVSRRRRDDVRAMLHLSQDPYFSLYHTSPFALTSTAPTSRLAWARRWWEDSVDAAAMRCLPKDTWLSWQAMVLFSPYSYATAWRQYQRQHALLLWSLGILLALSTLWLGHGHWTSVE